MHGFALGGVNQRKDTSVQVKNVSIRAKNLQLSQNSTTLLHDIHQRERWRVWRESCAVSLEKLPESGHKSESVPFVS